VTEAEIVHKQITGRFGEGLKQRVRGRKAQGLNDTIAPWSSGPPGGRWVGLSPVASGPLSKQRLSSTEERQVPPSNCLG
jgi:hypothetical protein